MQGRRHRWREVASDRLTLLFVCFLGSCDMLASFIERKRDVPLAQFVSTSIAHMSSSCPFSPLGLQGLEAIIAGNVELFLQQLAAGTQTASSLPALKDTFSEAGFKASLNTYSDFVLRMGCHHP